MNHGLSYSKWILDHRSILKNLSEKEIYFLFSGGKDSSLAMDFLLRAGREFGFSFEAHVGAFPIHRYGQDEKKRISTYWQGRGINPVWHEPAETDLNLETMEKPCLTCQSIRKKMLKPFFLEQVKNWHNLVIITSYSLWDLVSYGVERMLTTLLRDQQEEADVRNKQRMMETAQRFHPLLKMKEGYTVFRPLVRYDGRDISYRVENKGIPTLKTPCRYQDQRPKRLLEKYYDKLEMGFDYDKLLAYIGKSLLFPDESAWAAMDRDEYLDKYF